MNLPNYLTLSRIGLLFVIVALLFVPWPWAGLVALILFILASLTDWLDGYLARKYNLVSNFGKLMDALADKILIVGMFVALLGVGTIPRWGVFPILIIIGREFLVTGLRLIAASKGQVLAAEKIGKVKTSFQISSVIFLLIYNVILQNLELLGVGETFLEIVYIAAQIVFGVAAAITAYSGYCYMRRYAYLVFQDEA